MILLGVVVFSPGYFQIPPPIHSLALDFFPLLPPVLAIVLILTQEYPRGQCARAEGDGRATGLGEQHLF